MYSTVVVFFSIFYDAENLSIIFVETALVLGFELPVNYKVHTVFKERLIL